MNIRFEYLYRDAGNFKNWGEIVLPNPNNLSAELIELIARGVLIDCSFFVASTADIPDLYFDRYIERLDHGWHEFSSFHETSDAPTDTCQRNIEQFIESLRLASLI